MSIYLAVDLGTTGCRSILFNDKSDMIASHYEEYPLITPYENYVEQDANLWWKLTLDTALKAIEKSSVSPKEIDGISISSQGITVVPVDKDINPLCNALSWLDTRAEAEAIRIKNDFTEEKVFSLTGKPVLAAYTLPKILWIKENAPEIFEKAYKFLMPLDFLIAKFTGVCVTDYSMASGTLMYDLKNFCWSEEILNHYGIGSEKLPKLSFAGEKVSFVKPEIAKMLGLKENCVVSVGAQDQKCAAFGAGLKDNVMTVSLGTSAAITKYWGKAYTEENRGVGWCGYVNDAFVTEGVINTAGTSLRWVRDTFYKNEDYDIIDKEADDALKRGCSLLFYPFLAGSSSPFYYPESTGNFYGVTLATTRGDFALATMEGIAFQIRTILDTMDAYKNVDTIILFGGGAKSDFWASVISDVTGLEIHIPESSEAASYGACMLAAKGVGTDLKPLKIKKVFHPKRNYDEKYLKYLNIEKKLWS